VNWKTLDDNEHATEDPLIIPDGVVHDSPACATELADVTDLNKLFFDEFFPSVVGHAKIIDKFHADPRSPFCTSETENMMMGSNKSRVVRVLATSF
jgi:hypothetical protein